LQGVGQHRLTHEIGASRTSCLKAYDWGNIEVPPFVTPTNDAETKALDAFHDAVIDRLFALNETRAEQEALEGAGASKNGGKRAKPAAASPNEFTLTAPDTNPAPTGRKRRTRHAP
jgi:hypothetical protein